MKKTKSTQLSKTKKLNYEEIKEDFKHFELMPEDVFGDLSAKYIQGIKLTKKLIVKNKFFVKIFEKELKEINIKLQSDGHNTLLLNRLELLKEEVKLKSEFINKLETNLKEKEINYNDVLKLLEICKEFKNNTSNENKDILNTYEVIRKLLKLLVNFNN